MRRVPGWSVVARWALMSLAFVVLVTVVGCGLFSGGGPSEPGRSAPQTLSVRSDAFADGAAIPVRFSCDGANVSPPLAWTGVPSHARSLAIVVADPDAPGGNYVHWVLFDLDPQTAQLAEDEAPDGARQARNSAGHPSYDGPCPPSGEHRYRFNVYALGSRVPLEDGADLDEALDAIDERALARGVLVGTFAAGASD